MINVVKGDGWICCYVEPAPPPHTYTAELVTKLYEAAVRKVPSSEEYHSHLFMAYARVGEYKKMQQVPGSSHTPVCQSCSVLWMRGMTLRACVSTGWNGALQDSSQEPLLFLVCDEFGHAGRLELDHKRVDR